MAKLCYFYKLKPDEIERLPADTVETLWGAITMIEAQNALTQIKLLSYTHMKSERQTELHRELHAQAFPNSQKKRSLTFEDVQAKIAGRRF